MPGPHPQLAVTSRRQWRSWLAEHHTTSRGVLLVLHRRGRGPHVPYDDLVEEALCFGWVDSTRRPVDADRFSLQMTPRRPGSGWSAVNKERIARLEAAGLMRPAGRAMVAMARASGAWGLLDAVEALIEPPDLTAALDAHPAARRYWDGMSPSRRKVVLASVMQARRAETRARRIALAVADAEAAAGGPNGRPG